MNQKRVPVPTDAALIVTYRCPMKCTMCSIHKNSSKQVPEVSPAVYEKLPDLKFINITGGEPFIRSDLDEIIQVVRKKAKRIIISTSGWFVEKVISLFEKYPGLGIRVSLEGLSVMNDKLRGQKGGFDRGLTVLLELRRMGIKDIGFGITISDKNSEDMLRLYELAKNLNMQFATATVHNSFYFHKYDNSFTDPEKVVSSLNKLIHRLLNERHPKSWFRAYFNFGLTEFIRGRPRLLPCEAGLVNFFIDPAGDIYPCNGLEDPEISGHKDCWFENMGNLKQADSFRDIWESEKAKLVRRKVASCPKNCWMIGTVAPVMKKYLKNPFVWVVKNRLKVMFHRSFDE